MSESPTHDFMLFVPVNQALTNNSFKNIRLVATDMDGTLTSEGKFTASLLHALEDLAENGFSVLIVTGRSAGWVSGLASYLPVKGAIAENGGLFYYREEPVALTPIPDFIVHRQELADIFEQLKAKFPQIQESADNRFRITDWTFDNRNITISELQIMGELCNEMGWGFTYSSVQCHIKPQQQDKANGLLKVLAEYFPHVTPEEVITVGDSPNDESLFDARYFPVSVGVANVLEYANQLNHKPAYVTTAAEGKGFEEVARSLLISVTT